MDGVLADDVQGLPAGVGLVEAVALGGEIDFQSSHDVPLVVADQNIRHSALFPPFFKILSQDG